MIELTAGFDKPSFLNILLADPDAIVDALDLVLETAEAASLGPSGIVTSFPIPYTPNAIHEALGAGTPNNVLAQARQSIIPSIQVNFLFTSLFLLFPGAFGGNLTISLLTLTCCPNL